MREFLWTVAAVLVAAVAISWIPPDPEAHCPHTADREICLHRLM